MMLLAQQSDSRSIFVWSFVLIVVVMAGFVVVAWVRRQMKAPDEPTGPGFTLADLREMRRNGQMTDEEFEKAKAKILASLQPSEEEKDQ